MPAVVRRYRGTAGLNHLLTQRPQDVERLLSDVPAFVAYSTTRAGDALAAVMGRDDQIGTQESSRRAAA